MKNFLFIILITFFSFSSAVFAKTEIWDCDGSLHKINTTIPDIFVKSKGTDKWFSISKFLPSAFIDYNNQSGSMIIYQQGRVYMVFDLSRRLAIGFESPNPIEYDQCELN
jgi:hypothetical protein